MVARLIIVLFAIALFFPGTALADKPKAYLSKDAKTGETLYVKPVTVQDTKGKYVVVWFTYRFKK
jgi:hypothetical protein